MDEVPLYSPGTEAKPRNTHAQPDGEDGSFRDRADLSWIRSNSSLWCGKDRSMSRLSRLEV